MFDLSVFTTPLSESVRITGWEKIIIDVDVVSVENQGRDVIKLFTFFTIITIGKVWRYATLHPTFREYWRPLNNNNIRARHRGRPCIYVKHAKFTVYAELYNFCEKLGAWNFERS